MRKTGIVILILTIACLIWGTQAFAQYGSRSYETDYSGYSNENVLNPRTQPFATQGSGAVVVGREGRVLSPEEAGKRDYSDRGEYYYEDQRVDGDLSRERDYNADAYPYRNYNTYDRTPGYYEGADRAYNRPDNMDDRDLRTLDPRTQPFATQGSGAVVVGREGRVLSPEEAGKRDYSDRGEYYYENRSDDQNFERDRYYNDGQGRVERYYGDETRGNVGKSYEGSGRYYDESTGNRINPREQPFGTRGSGDSHSGGSYSPNPSAESRP